MIEPDAGPTPRSQRRELPCWRGGLHQGYFAPQEVVDCKRTLRCEFLDQVDEGMEPS